jgi:hypothetical protein
LRPDLIEGFERTFIHCQWLRVHVAPLFWVLLDHRGDFAERFLILAYPIRLTVREFRLTDCARGLARNRESVVIEDLGQFRRDTDVLA